MLGYLVLFFLQLAAGWFGAPFLLKFIPAPGDARIFVHAALFAPLIWATGVLASYILKDVRLPSTVTLAWALIGALIGAVIVSTPLKSYLPAMPPLFLPLLTSILGYMLKK